MKESSPNPYFPSSSELREGVQPPTRFLPCFAVTTMLLGVISWATMFSGLRDVEIRQEPGYRIVLHPTELTVAFGLGCASFVVGVIGFVRCFATDSHRLGWMVGIAALTFFSCLPAVAIGQQYLLVTSSN